MIIRLCTFLCHLSMTWLESKLDPSLRPTISEGITFFEKLCNSLNEITTARIWTLCCCYLPALYAIVLHRHSAGHSAEPGYMYVEGLAFI
ncbi:uncharacterized protein BT62DRAFT_332588 [Guyanagaster necrorhizus]|uniref:Uncharacterized protein n=1 Tax=Guyanagaster necrorhizus TaxID=856835 RepID=A0A9P7VLN5_9AGAR|nr:uncharacterized protein BT62DRAFT_332588 [Guyanagaster necrorhizus MCA 3950]KAG7443461.1 hypothetical protein BT62DRAFT_332588 [Guyanagaster necrorhizus MCA 3950]